MLDSGNQKRSLLSFIRKHYISLGRNGFLNWMSDKRYLRMVYKAKMGRKLCLDNPTTYNEKLQWLKLYDRNPLYTQLADKYEVRKYVAEQIGEEYLIPLLGVWDRFEDIDFNQLPDQFVLKCNHDSGGLVICRDKSDFDIKKARKKINRCLKRNYYWAGREWPYKNIKPKITAEKYMFDEKQKSLIDYKFYCFSGEPKFLYVSTGLEDHLTAKISFFDLDGNKMPFKRHDFAEHEEKVDMPDNFNLMKEIAKACSKNTPFLRVDLYEISGKVYFSELTTTPSSGFVCFHPEEWDAKLGGWLVLPNDPSKSNNPKEGRVK